MKLKEFFIFTIISILSSIAIYGNTIYMEPLMTEKKLEKATVGGGCFWCIEAIFQQVKGVESVVSGYAGGEKDDPSYQEVCSGSTGHAEVVQVNFDPEVVSYRDILEIFWRSHDPTTLNRQGADVGTQYRSIILYHNDEQKDIANKFKAALNDSDVFFDPVVTEISKFDKFYPAEDYHQNYYKNNPNKPYCSYVIAPKVEKFEAIFKDKLK